MTHDVTVSAAECGKCNGDIAQWTTREKESWVHMVHFEHLKAQKDALWDAAVAAFGPEPIKFIIESNHTMHVWTDMGYDLKHALRAQMEAKS